MSESNPVFDAVKIAEEFDREFAVVPADADRQRETFLAIRLGDDPYAVRTAEVAGLVADRRVIPLPTLEPALLGVASFRGRVLPVYDMSTLLGGAARPASRWLLLVGGGELALSVTSFEEQFSLPAGEQLAAAQALASRPHVRGVVQVRGKVRPVADLTSVLAEIRRRALSGRPS